MKNLLFLFVCLSLSSCFLSKKSRANRKIKKAMVLDPSRFKNDTLRIRDTIFIVSTKSDTVTNIIYHDTVTVINNNKVSLKYFYDTTRLEIWHDVECKADTVFLDKEIVVEKVTFDVLFEFDK